MGSKTPYVDTSASTCAVALSTITTMVWRPNSSPLPTPWRSDYGHRLPLRGPVASRKVTVTSKLDKGALPAARRVKLRKYQDLVRHIWLGHLRCLPPRGGHLDQAHGGIGQRKRRGPRTHDQGDPRTALQVDNKSAHSKPCAARPRSAQTSVAATPGAWSCPINGLAKTRPTNHSKWWQVQYRAAALQEM